MKTAASENGSANSGALHNHEQASAPGLETLAAALIGLAPEEKAKLVALQLGQGK